MSKQTAIVSLYSINWLVFITEGLLRGTDWVFIYNLDTFDASRGLAIVQAISRQSLIAVVHIRSQSSSCGTRERRSEVVQADRKSVV